MRRLTGDGGTDTLLGNGGNDVLIGGTNAGPDGVKDTLTGNAGADQFRNDMKIVIVWVNGKQLAIPGPEDRLTDFNAGGGDTKY